MKTRHTLIALALTAACAQSSPLHPSRPGKATFHPSAKTGSSACGKPR
jgi:hypothetical protein